jgi:hypothetical protein
MLARGLAVFALIASAMLAVSFVTAQEDTTPSSTPDATPEATPSAEMPRLELELEELNDSGINGTVTLYEFGDRTIVEFDVEGSGGDHPANISVGTCGDLEPEPAFELQRVNEDGESLTVVDASLDELLESPHAVEMRLAPDQLGTLIACADIEGEPQLPTDGTPVATPTGEGGQVTVAGTETPAQTPTATATSTATSAVVPGTTPEATAVSTPEDGTGGAVSGDEPTATIQLEELNDSGVSGTVVLTAQGQATRISINLTGNVTGDHVAHLHDGTCEAPGEYTYTLNPVSANGTSETVVNLTLDELLSGAYFVNVHPSEANWDTWMVCGQLVSTGGTVTTANITPTPTTPATTGGQQTVAPTATVPVQVVPGATTSPVTTPIPSGKGTSTTTTTTTTAAGDGTAGVTGGTTSTGAVQTLPQTAGVGAMLQWPTDPRTAILWATAAAAAILGVSALVIRRGERGSTTTHSRWTRLGI